jgi:hypothetical protein
VFNSINQGGHDAHIVIVEFLGMLGTEKQGFGTDQGKQQIKLEMVKTIKLLIPEFFVKGMQHFLRQKQGSLDIL